MYWHCCQIIRAYFNCRLSIVDRLSGWWSYCLYLWLEIDGFDFVTVNPVLDFLTFTAVAVDVITRCLWPNPAVYYCLFFHHNDEKFVLIFTVITRCVWPNPTTAFYVIIMVKNCALDLTLLDLNFNFLKIFRHLLLLINKY